MSGDPKRRRLSDDGLYKSTSPRSPPQPGNVRPWSSSVSELESSRDQNKDQSKDKSTVTSRTQGQGEASSSAQAHAQAQAQVETDEGYDAGRDFPRGPNRDEQHFQEYLADAAKKAEEEGGDVDAARKQAWFKWHLHNWVVPK